jgi:O-antigen ligase
MTIGEVQQLARSGAQFLFVKAKWVLIGVSIIGLGVALGCSLSWPQTADLTISLFVISFLMVIVANNPLDGLPIWVFFMQFLETWIKIPLGAGIPDLSFSRFLIAFLGIFMLARAATGRFRFVRIGIVDVCIVLTTIGIMVAAPQSLPSPQGVIQVAIAWYFTPLVGYYFAKNLVRDRQDVHRILLAVALLGFVSAASAAYEHATGDILFRSGHELVGERMLYRGESGIRIIRSLWGTSGTMGQVLAMSIPVTFYLLFESRNGPTLKVCLLAMLLVQFYGILVTMSRTPWYSLLIALFVMQLFYPRFRTVFLVIVLVAAVVLWATWDRVVESDAASRINDKVSTLEGRQMRWRAGVNMWRAKPIRGWGFGRYVKESGRFRTDGDRRNLSAIENDYLHILVGSGLIGFVPYLLSLLIPLVNSIRLFLRTRSRDWSGFVKAEMIAVYWAVLLPLAIGSYTSVQSEAGLRLIVCTVAGAIVGTHETLLGKPGKPFLSLSPLKQRA